MVFLLTETTSELNNGCCFNWTLLMVLDVNPLHQLSDVLEVDV